VSGAVLSGMKWLLCYPLQWVILKTHFISFRTLENNICWSHSWRG